MYCFAYVNILASQPLIIASKPGHVLSLSLLRCTITNQHATIVAIRLIVHGQEITLFAVIWQSMHVHGQSCILYVVHQGGELAPNY